jgi:hypothetical protein
MYDYQTKGYGKFGANMGRPSDLDHGTEDACLIRKVPIDDQGYDPGGAYWGTPDNLYYIESQDSGKRSYLRASSMQAAMATFPLAAWIERASLADLADMVQSYIACALWSSSDESDESGGVPLDKNYSVDDLAPATLATMKMDCEKFLYMNIKDIGPNAAQAGHDLWLTRNGHGCGFWDSDWPTEAGKRLTVAAHALGEVSLYLGDGGTIYQG